MRRFFAAAALILGTFQSAQVRADVLVFAAASLTDALTAVAEDYAATGAAKPVFSFAASSALARQIENGAPAAIFVSADEQWMDYLAERSLIDSASRVTLLGNRLVLISPTPLMLEITAGVSLDTALAGGKLALADPDSVPAGKYAKAALERLGVWPSVERQVVRADNVRAALAFVERGEARLGVVYATDAAASRKVSVAGFFPQDSHPPISYPAALVKADAQARTFFAYMQSDAAKAVYARFGFSVK